MLVEIVGIIINERNYGDNDKIVTIFSDSGKLYSVKVIAGRKLKNINRSKTQMFCYGEFKIKENPDRFSVLKSVTINEQFLELKIDLEKYYNALYFCELITKLGYYNNLEAGLFIQFILALKKLSSEKEYISTRILFEFIILRYIGIMPHFDACVVCGNTNIVSVDYKLGGFICSNCFDFSHEKYEVKTLAILKALNNIEFSRVGKITLSEAVLNDISKFVDQYIEYHLNIKLNTKSFIK
ncbi:MAG: DNA repair protein RecO [Bacilli bacterium]